MDGPGERGFLSTYLIAVPKTCWIRVPLWQKVADVRQGFSNEDMPDVYHLLLQRNPVPTGLWE